jgi:hypothetical protein
MGSLAAFNGCGRWRRLTMRILIGATGLWMLALSAHADDLRCTDADRSTWLPAAQVQKMLRDHGFADVGAVQVDAGNCYVVQATDQSGSRKTLYLDPTSGALMALE